jgi:hypothetical protein
MLQTIKLNFEMYAVSDESRVLYLFKNTNNVWGVFNPNSETYIATELDTFDEAEGTAFQYLSLVSA